MSKRGSQLAIKVDEQISEMVEFLTGLSESELQAPCHGDLGGSTVGAVAAHVAAGYGQALGFLRRRPGPTPGLKPPQARPVEPGPAEHDHAGHDHAHPGSHTHSEPHSPGETHTHTAGGHTHTNPYAHFHASATYRPGRKQEMIDQLKRDGAATAQQLRTVSDEQLDGIPPAISRIADGKRPLIAIVEDVVEHQTAHLESMRKSVAQYNEPSREAL